MKSIANELWRVLSIFSPLFFFVSVSVYVFLLLNAWLQYYRHSPKWSCYIWIKREVTAGFYSSYVDSSSLTGICFEKEVKLPIDNISEINPDCYYTHSMRKIFDNADYIWKDGRITYMSIPKHFRCKLPNYGFAYIPKNLWWDVDKGIIIS